MSDYDEDFEKEDAQPSDEKQHKMKLSIDFLSVKDFKVAANLLLSYSLKLMEKT
jgi:hypothetical protein